MGFDGLDAQMKLLGNFLRREAAPKESKDLKFTVAELLGEVAGGVAAKKPLEHERREAFADVNVPPQHGSDGMQQFISGFFFHDVTQRPGPQRQFGMDRF